MMLVTNKASVILFALTILVQMSVPNAASASSTSSASGAHGISILWLIVASGG